MAWLAVGKDSAVISHESALEFFELSDVLPHAIHLTVPRSRRNLPKIPGVKIHTSTRPFGPLDGMVQDGIRVTSAGRAILDSAEAGAAPEQVEMATARALDRGLIGRKRFLDDARHRSHRVQDLVNQALRWAHGTGQKRCSLPICHRNTTTERIHVQR